MSPKAASKRQLPQPSISKRVRALERRQKASDHMGKDHTRRLARLEQSWETWLKEALGRVLQASYQSSQKAEVAIQRIEALEIQSSRATAELSVAIAELGMKVDALGAQALPGGEKR